MIDPGDIRLQFCIMWASWTVKKLPVSELVLASCPLTVIINVGSLEIHLTTNCSAKNVQLSLSLSRTLASQSCQQSLSAATSLHTM